MTTCTKRYTDIPFAHRQPDHAGHCRFIHGHNWSFEFEFVCREKDECGFVVDFGNLQPLKDWLARLDHALVLNASDPLVKTLALQEVLAFTMGDGGGQLNLLTVPDCSCEGLAEWALVEADRIVGAMTQGRVAVRRCTVFEDSKNSATSQV